MPLHIPKREQLLRITVGDAFARLVQQTIKPDSDIGRNRDVAAAAYFASMRIYQRSTMTEAQAQSSIFVMDFLDTDPIDIASTILDGIAARRLSVKGLPDELMESWIKQPFINDWALGQVRTNIAGIARLFYPTLDRAEIERLFNPDFSEASPADVTKEADATTPSVFPESVPEKPKPQTPVPPKRGPGRPGASQLILKEWLARKERGETLPVAADEARALVALVARKHPTVTLPKLSTIQTHLSNSFATLKGQVKAS